MEDKTFVEWIAELKKYFGPASDKVDPNIWYLFWKKGISPNQIIEYIIGK